MSARTSLLAIVLFTAGIAFAQEAPAPAPAAPEAAPAPPAPCMVQGARHDHGAEKGMPTPKMSGCPMAAPTASAAPAKAKAKPGHDHSKFHKLM
jgi:hypothetical protein